ncbi:uncharacterized protein J7T54_007338 [Emericellopsis cladophorae]|uniref:Zn(2)-C6 fungal-type domain-containing protein n=1 Tax=Emericellopsis cladophorae TaxID=2686198 RepID=A0A9P9Y0G0_9HYPO|nr:uncharacterized protein J7T54_007338 [Emericellopsis cladophorae]KAI6780858.1 hypothetical protein J7T54_007338 [Emericellopsis cladophorae]
MADRKPGPKNGVPKPGVDSKRENGREDGKSPKKRRKVNHACVYCRRSHMTCDLERPCTRCIKRNIGHLCHDEPRESETKKPKAASTSQSRHPLPPPPPHPDDNVMDTPSEMGRSSISSNMGPPPTTYDTGRPRTSSGGFAGGALPASLPIVQQQQATGLQGRDEGSGSNSNQCFSDAWMTAQNFEGMNSFNPNYMITPEVTHEFNLLNDFLHTSLLDDNGIPPDEAQQAFRQVPNQDMLPQFLTDSAMQAAGKTPTGAMLPPPTVDGNTANKPASALLGDKDKTREYYLQAADPSGNDNPEERMGRVLRAKYDAGLLKPFNYINGYARLGKYLDGHIAPSSKQKILRTMTQFRPKFREKAQGLTDMQLVYVEMWFERQLMDYDRVFASMAVPACCWRRTGEIFRGNKEMAELIHVPVDKLRDGKIALHEILTEESMVRYWEEFGTIAFDPAHETLLTACSLKSPDDGSNHPVVKCCFSFTIKRDEHKFTAHALLDTSTAHAEKAMPRQIQDPAALGRERKAQTIIDFTKDAIAQLPRVAGNEDILTADISHQLHVIASLSQKPLQHHIARSLEIEGRDLWNLCIKLKRERKAIKILPKARLLAFHVLELGRLGVEPNRGRAGAVDGVVYLLGLLLTLGRICLAENDLESGRIALQKGALYVDKLKSLQGGNTAGRRSLEAGHITLHMALSWREGKLDVAEHMFGKAKDLIGNLEATSAEDMADTLRHIGADISDKKDYAMGTKWLWRAYNVINTPPLDHLSTDGLDSRLAICQSLVQSLLGMNTPEATAEANDLVAYVESEIGDKPIVLHWRLEILQKSPSEGFQPAPYASILRRMVRAFDFTQQTLEFLLHHVKKLSENSVSLACGVMDELITQIVLQTKQSAWIDKTVVRRVWMSTMATDGAESDMEKLATMLDVVLASSAEPLSMDVAGAAQSLIWKKIEAAFVRKQYAATNSWCRVALHGLFANCGSSNKAKFGRKRMLCALELNDLDAARSSFSAMEPAVQSEPLSQYLFFKTALRSWDTEAACQSIVNLAEGTTHQSGQDLLLRLITMLKAERSPLRKRSRDELEGQETPDLFVEDACVLFELGKPVMSPFKVVLTLMKAAERARLTLKNRHGDKILTVPELHWFRKNSYNMGVAACTSASWTLSDVVRIFAACLVFCGSYPEDIPQQDRDDVHVMSLRSHFVLASALVSLARTKDSIEESLQRYLETRKHVAAFDGLLENASDQQHVIMADLRAKASTLSESCRDESCLKAMGDCLLRSEAPARVLYTTLRLLINSLHTLSPMNASLLTKYIRTLFHAMLPLDDTLALTLIDQAVEIAAEVKTLPKTELEWLVARTFNHAIDYYARGEEEDCRIWARKGMALAGAMSDGGVLRTMLEERFAKLRFDESARKRGSR